MKKSRRTYNGVHLNKKSNTQDVVEQSLTLVQSCTERLIIFLPIGLTVGPGKKAAKNTLSNKVGEEDFSTASVSGS